MIRLRHAVRQLREWRQARRDYRALGAEGRAAHIRVDIRIHPGDDEWTGLDGVTGIKTTIPLTPAGKRYVKYVLADIERTCVRAVLKATRDAARAAVSASRVVQTPGHQDRTQRPPATATAPPATHPAPDPRHRNEDTDHARR
ncbi:hypothetical protein MF672_038935 [Actinomadura sp. ATCC 31491]|uniref:Uncharacterized protein n=1 Tax=Actinomadura luzonensis TaxID=2805427 RepID=A0ABT0G575_9ACTN|nr:hypothetical protein [Actinomadura luzonensis]MCK2219730.1 hypothetical protein [Actinomadura luzonensis]